MERLNRSAVARAVRVCFLVGAALSIQTQAFASENHAFWRSEGADEFAKGSRRNLEIDDSGAIVLGGSSFDPAWDSMGIFESRVYEAEHSFNSAQIGFGSEIPAGCDMAVEVRALDPETGFRTRWARVDQEEDVVFGASFSALQYRVRMQTYGELDGERPSFQFFTATFANVLVEAEEPPTARDWLEVAKPQIVSRSEWGARAPRGRYSSHSIQRLIVHHSSAPNASQYQGAATVRGIQRFHIVDRGWTDVGYHFLIGPDGVIYQGRPETKRGAHCTPNSGKVGICMIGNFQGTDELTEEAEASLVDLLAWLTSNYKVAGMDHIQGHRDWNSTNCPGDSLYQKLPSLRTKVKAKLEGEPAL